MQNSDTKAAKGIKTVSIMMLLVLLAKISGFVRDVSIVRLLGETPEGVAFTFASQVPRNFLDAAFAAAISASFIPVFNSYLEKNTKKEAFDVANNFITFAIIVALAASLFGFFAAEPIAAFFFDSASAYEVAMAAGLLQIMVFTITTTTLAFAFIGVLQSLGGFYIPSIMSLVSNIVIMAYILVFFDYMGVFGLAGAFMVGNVLQLAIFIAPLRKRGFVYRVRLSIRDAALKQILRLSPLFLMAAWLFPINNLVHTWVIPNFHEPGGLVELQAANTIYIVVTGFFVLSVTNVLFPRLSKEAAKASMGKTSDFAEVLSGVLSGVLFILLPMSAGLFILSEPIVHMAHYGGQFTAENAARAGSALGFLTFGMVGFGLTSILTRAFFAIMQAKIPVIASLIAIFFNAALSILLIGSMGISGVALAGAFSITVAGVFMLIIAQGKFGIITKKSAVNMLKMLVCTAVMAGILGGVWQFVGSLPGIIAIGIIVILGVIIYAAASMTLKTQEAELAKSLILSRIKRG